jgi:hypothetical protein
MNEWNTLDRTIVLRYIILLFFGVPSLLELLGSTTKVFSVFFFFVFFCFVSLCVFFYSSQAVLNGLFFLR